MNDKAKVIDEAIDALGLADWRVTGAEVRRYVFTGNETGELITIELEHGETGATLKGEAGSFGKAFADAARRVRQLREDPDAS